MMSDKRYKVFVLWIKSSLDTLNLVNSGLVMFYYLDIESNDNEQRKTKNYVLLK